MTMPPPDASRAREGLRERAVRLWRWRYDLRSFFAPLSDDKQPHLSSMPTPRDADEYLALPAADMERLLAADALRVVHHRDPGTPSAAALAYAETFLRENGYYDDGTPTRTFALALDDFARAALGGAK